MTAISSAKGSISISGKIYFASAAGSISITGGTTYLWPLTWEGTTEAPVSHTNISNSVCELDDLLYVFGGSVTSTYGSSADLQPGTYNTAYAFNPATLTWSQLPDMPDYRHDAAAASLHGTVHVVGGAESHNNNIFFPWQTTLSPSHWTYDPNLHRWTVLANIPRNAYAASLVSNGSALFLIGGITSARTDNGLPLAATALCHKWTAESQAWTAIAPTPTPTAWSVAAWDGHDTIYLAGGWTPSAPLSTLYAYTISTNTWSTKAPLPAAVGYAGGTIHVGALYVVASPTSYRYDLAHDTWTNLTGTTQDTPFAVNHSGAAVLSTGMHVVGGDFSVTGGLYSNTQYLAPHGRSAWDIAVTAMAPDGWYRLNGSLANSGADQSIVLSKTDPLLHPNAAGGGGIPVYTAWGVRDAFATGSTCLVPIPVGEQRGDLTFLIPSKQTISAFCLFRYNGINAPQHKLGVVTLGYYDVPHVDAHINVGRFQMGTAGGSLGVPARSVLDGKWHLIGLMQDATKSYLSVDGLIVQTDPTAPTAKNNIHMAASSGYYDEPLIFYRTLSTTEIADLWNTIRSRLDIPIPDFGTGFDSQRFALDVDGTVMFSRTQTGGTREIGPDQRRLIMRNDGSTLVLPSTINEPHQLRIVFPEPRDLHAFLILGITGTWNGSAGSNGLVYASLDALTVWDVSYDTTDGYDGAWTNGGLTTYPDRGFALAVSGGDVTVNNPPLVYAGETTFTDATGDLIDATMFRNSEQCITFVFGSGGATADEMCYMHTTGVDAADRRNLGIFKSGNQGVKGIRLRISGYTTATFANFTNSATLGWNTAIQLFHLYGTRSVTTSAYYSIDLWQTNRDKPFTLDMSSLGTVAWRESQDITFRVRNLSQLSSARSISVYAEALVDNTYSFTQQLMFRRENDPNFYRSITIGTLAPGDRSEIITMRRVTPLNAGVGTYLPRIRAQVGSWL